MDSLALAEIPLSMTITKSYWGEPERAPHRRYIEIFTYYYYIFNPLTPVALAIVLTAQPHYQRALLGFVFLALKS